jgi:hypothetical protein
MKPVPKQIAEEALGEVAGAAIVGALIEVQEVSVTGDKAAFDNLFRNIMVFLRTFDAGLSGKSK